MKTNKTNKTNKPIPYEETNPEDAKILMDICSEQAENKAQGKRNKPLMLDVTEPITYQLPEHLRHYECKTIKAGVKLKRNAPCPCGSGKKYKKCCIK